MNPRTLIVAGGLSGASGATVVGYVAQQSGTSSPLWLVTLLGATLFSLAAWQVLSRRWPR